IGVKGVNNLMDVKPLPAPSVSTTKVHSNIEATLKRSMLKDVDSITIEANSGKVMLHGKVQSWHEHDDVGRAAWSAPGVIAVENEIEVIN
ncbi:MAG: BON domain-containing protein, partial [Chloroflexota bacterium]